MKNLTKNKTFNAYGKIYKNTNNQGFNPLFVLNSLEHEREIFKIDIDRDDLKRNRKRVVLIFTSDDEIIENDPGYVASEYFYHNRIKLESFDSTDKIYYKSFSFI